MLFLNMVHSGSEFRANTSSFFNSIAEVFNFFSPHVCSREKKRFQENFVTLNKKGKAKKRLSRGKRGIRLTPSGKISFYKKKCCLMFNV